MKITQTDDLAACHALRRAVFIEEQSVSEAEEMDELDAVALHYLAEIDGKAVGTARMLIQGDTAKIGRVCMARDARGTGAGLALMRFVLDDARARGLRRAKLSSQTHAMGFYEKLGFLAYGDEYPDAGIPHRDMSREL